MTMVFILRSEMGPTAEAAFPAPVISWGVGLNQQTIAYPVTGTIPEFVRRIPCQKSQVSPYPSREILGRETGIVLIAGRFATGLREDRHAKARRPLVGSGSVAAAARVEPSPKGLAQAGKAIRTVGSFEFRSAGGCCDQDWRNCKLSIATRVPMAKSPSRRDSIRQ